VEEDAAVRRLAQAILEQAGYRVLPARNAFEATTISLSPNLHYDLLLTDVVMAGMNGYLLAQNLLRLRPALRVVYMSGHAPEPDDPDLAPSQRSVLHKPFGRVALLDHVRAALSPPVS
jgi:two-component system cell cycle sensor histidine kinase/response regulator CckA